MLRIKQDLFQNENFNQPQPKPMNSVFQFDPAGCNEPKVNLLDSLFLCQQPPLDCPQLNIPPLQVLQLQALLDVLLSPGNGAMV